MITSAIFRSRSFAASLTAESYCASSSVRTRPQVVKCLANSEIRRSMTGSAMISKGTASRKRVCATRSRRKGIPDVTSPRQTLHCGKKQNGKPGQQRDKNDSPGNILRARLDEPYAAKQPEQRPSVNQRKIVLGQSFSSTERCVEPKPTCRYSCLRDSTSRETSRASRIAGYSCPVNASSMASERATEWTGEMSP